MVNVSESISQRYVGNNVEYNHNPLTLLKKIGDNQFSTDDLLSNVAHPDKLKQKGGDIIVSAAFFRAVHSYLHRETPSQENQENKELLDQIIASLSSCTFKWLWIDEFPVQRVRHGCRVPLVQATMIVSAYWLLKVNWMRKPRSDRGPFLDDKQKKALMNILKFYANGRPPNQLESPQLTLPTLFAQILAYAALHMIKTGFSEWNEPPPHPTNDFISWKQDHQLNPALREEVDALKNSGQLYDDFREMIKELGVPILPQILN